MFQEATMFQTAEFHPTKASGNTGQPFRQPIRLTRRGRVVLRILLVTLMVAIALALTMLARAITASDVPSGSTVVVAPGDNPGSAASATGI